jgi:hypothetical protein
MAGFFESPRRPSPALAAAGGAACASLSAATACGDGGRGGGGGTSRDSLLRFIVSTFMARNKITFRLGRCAYVPCDRKKFNGGWLDYICQCPSRNESSTSETRASVLRSTIGNEDI